MEATESEGLTVTSQSVRGSGNSPQQTALPNGDGLGVRQIGMAQVGAAPPAGMGGRPAQDRQAGVRSES
jgi:hypothetical protein